MQFTGHTSLCMLVMMLNTRNQLLLAAIEILSPFNGKPLAPHIAADAIDQAFAERLHAQINAKVLRKRGFDVETFREKGKQKMTPSAYLALCSRIDQVSIKLKFLVCGFGPDQHGHIYCVDGENAPQNYDSLGMWAIGSGAYAAISSLAFHKDNQSLDTRNLMESACYFALEAKFMAESSNAVGDEGVFAAIMHRGSKDLHFIKNGGAEKIKAMWKAEAAPRVPTNLTERMAEYIVSTAAAMKAAAGEK